MKEILTISVLALLILGCSSGKNYKILNRNTDKKISDIEGVNDSLTLKDFNLFTFQLKRTYEKGDLNTANEVLMPVFELRLNDNDETGIIVEEIYLFMPKVGSKFTDVIVLNSFSHKNLFKDAGIFNCKYFKDKKIFIEDIDNVFRGKVDSSKNSIRFGHPKKSHLSMFWTYEKSDGIINITNVFAKRNYVVNEVYGVPFRFRKQERELIYGKGSRDYAAECFCKYDITKPNYFQKAHALIPVEKILFTSEYLYFKTKLSEENTSEAYEFPNEYLRYNN